MPQVEKEILAPGYNRARGGSFHLAANARDQDFSHPGMYLRAAIPDRVDIIEEVIAEGERVGLLFRVTGTHTGSFFGVPRPGGGSTSTSWRCCASSTARSSKAGS
jgi:hypothetical protein